MAVVFDQQISLTIHITITKESTRVQNMTNRARSPQTQLEVISNPLLDQIQFPAGDTPESSSDSSDEDEDDDDDEEEKEDGGEYFVQKILGSKIEKGVILYRIKWEGYGSSENTWEPEENLDGCSELLAEFKASSAHLTAHNKGHSGSASTSKRKAPQSSSEDEDEELTIAELDARATKAKRARLTNLRVPPVHSPIAAVNRVAQKYENTSNKQKNQRSSGPQSKGKSKVPPPQSDKKQSTSISKSTSPSKAGPSQLFKPKSSAVPPPPRPQAKVPGPVSPKKTRRLFDVSSEEDSDEPLASQLQPRSVEAPRPSQTRPPPSGPSSAGVSLDSQLAGMKSFKLKPLNSTTSEHNRPLPSPPLHPQPQPQPQTQTQIQPQVQSQTQPQPQAGPSRPTNQTSETHAPKPRPIAPPPRKNIVPPPPRPNPSAPRPNPPISRLPSQPPPPPAPTPAPPRPSTFFNAPLPPPPLTNGHSQSPTTAVRDLRANDSVSVLGPFSAPFALVNTRTTTATRDPRRRAPSNGPAEPARSALAPVVMPEPKRTVDDANDESIRNEVERKLRGSMFFQRHTAFQTSQLSVACAEVIRMPRDLPLKIHGKPCSILQGPPKQDSDRVVYEGESMTLGYLLLSLHAKTPTQVDDLESIFMYREEAFIQLANCFIDLVDRIPCVDFYAFGKGGPIVPILAHGYAIIPTLAALAQTVEVEKFLLIQRQGLSIDLRVHPATLILASTNSRFHTTTHTLQGFFSNRSALQLVQPEHLSRSPRTSPYHNLAIDELLSGRPFLPQVSLETEFEQIQVALNIHRSTLPVDKRRFIIVTDRPILAHVENCASKGIHLLTWEQVTRRVVDSPF